MALISARVALDMGPLCAESADTLHRGYVR